MLEDAITMTHGAEIVLDSVSDKERKHLFDLLKYLANKDITRYRTLIERLGLRR